MRRLKINLIDLEGAFETNSPEMHHYLDTETGEVLTVTDDFRQELERLWEDAGPEDKLEDLLRKSELPDWQRQALAKAQRVEEDYGTRVVMVPEPDADTDLRNIEAFITTVAEPRLREELQRATRGRGAFRRLREALEDDFRERERWFQFKRKCLRQHMADWLASLEIEPLWEEPKPLPPQLPVRTQLLEAALTFVRSAARLPGVKRIALIGSLAMPEPSPKDIDLLVTITDEMDLAPLAKAARQLNGRAMQTGRSRGGEVFLADVGGNYLGRTCPWKECGPGIRLSCDALHCGQRHYLHDDLQAIKLQPTLIHAPPIELWPAVVTRVAAPTDVEELLLKPIREGLQSAASQLSPTKPEGQEHE
jgi:predicted nucleotidyltransferase